jgi:hypothetical protein
MKIKGATLSCGKQSFDIAASIPYTPATPGAWIGESATIHPGPTSGKGT